MKDRWTGEKAYFACISEVSEKISENSIAAVRPAAYLPFYQRLMNCGEMTRQKKRGLGIVALGLKSYPSRTNSPVNLMKLK